MLGLEVRIKLLEVELRLALAKGSLSFHNLQAIIEQLPGLLNLVECPRLQTPIRASLGQSPQKQLQILAISLLLQRSP